MRNMCWPREYPINSRGFILHDYAGEGDHNIAKIAIRSLLAECAALDGLKKLVSKPKPLQ